MTQYPRRFLPALLVVLIALLLTGLALTPTTLALRAEWPVPWRASGGDRVWLAALHSAGAFAAAAFVGALWSVHMRSGWRRRRQRASGVLLALTLGLLALTAVGVYYLGDERLAALSAYGHIALGLLTTVLFAWHAIRGRASLARARRAHAGGHPTHGRRHP